MNIKRYICALLALAVSASAFVLSGCGEEADKKASDDKAVKAETSATEDDSSETEPAADSENQEETKNVIDLSGYEKTDVDITTEEYKREKSSKVYRRVSLDTFSDGTNEYNWYEFYNACLDGLIDFSSVEVKMFADGFLEFFTDMGLEEEIAQAQLIVDCVNAAS